MFPAPHDKATLLRYAIISSPHLNIRGYTWRIANVETINTDAIHFCIGRNGTRSLPSTDPTGRFVEEEAEITPFTYAITDVYYQLCAIAHRPSLGARPNTIANNLTRLLSASPIASEHNVRFAITPIKEPAPFLQRIQKAETVTRIWITTLRPNPFDEEEDFIEPIARSIDKIHAESAKTTWSGDFLNKHSTTLARVVEGTAARGGDAGARIRETGESRPKNITMSGSVTLTVNLPLDNQSLSDWIRSKYHQIRKNLQ